MGKFGEAEEAKASPQPRLGKKAEAKTEKIISSIRNVKIALWCVIMIRFDSWDFPNKNVGGWD